jgi:hypothetical protein
MWVNDVEFDGRTITGTLLNSPNWLTSVKEGDSVEVSLSDISDWMYVIENRAYGAFTVNLMRSRMSNAERREHDQAWGLDFGDPNKVLIVPLDWFQPKSKGGFFSKLFGGKSAEPPADVESAEHPMSVNMGPSLRDHLQKNPSAANEADKEGWTFLHHQSLAGDLNGVQILLEAGANPNAVTKHRMTPLQLARSLGWDRIAEVLIARGAR